MYKQEISATVTTQLNPIIISYQNVEQSLEVQQILEEETVCI